MNSQTAIDMGREAISTGLWIAGPILIVGLIIGLVVGILQAMTQVQDQTVGFTPRILLMILALSLCLPWLASQMLEYSKSHFGELPEHLSVTDVDWDADTPWQ